jgi:hypothetical protein
VHDIDQNSLTCTWPRHRRRQAAGRCRRHRDTGKVATLDAGTAWERRILLLTGSTALASVVLALQGLR